MKRYDVGLGVGHGGYSIDVSPTGDWVLHADVAERIVALEKALFTLGTEVLAWRAEYGYFNASPAPLAPQVVEAANATDASEALTYMIQ